MVNLIKISPDKSDFGPSFSGKIGETDFYKIRFNDKNVGEIEFNPEKSEILSIYVDGSHRGKNIAKLAVNKLFDYYDVDTIYAWAAKTSIPFWKKISDMELPNNYFAIKRSHIIKEFSKFKKVQHHDIYLYKNNN